MGLVVDAANVVGSRPDGWWRDRVGATRRLLEALAAATAADPDLGPVVAVVEGKARAVPDVPGVSVVRASGLGDDEVVAQARRRPDVTVVTADRGLRARLPEGTATMGPASLWRVLEPGDSSTRGGVAGMPEGVVDVVVHGAGAAVGGPPTLIDPEESLDMPLTLGQLAVAFTLPRAGGGTVTLDTVTPDTSAAPATVVVWTCNHCPYALAWHDRVQDVARDYADQGVRVVQINSNDAARYPTDSFDAMAERVARGELASDYVHDADQTVARAWGARVTPDVFILDAAGRLAYRGAPDGDHTDESQRAGYVREALDDLLAGRPVRRPETEPRGCSVKWLAAS